MHRPSSSLRFAVFHALLLVAATLLAGRASAPWPPVAAPLVLVLGILAADAVAQRQRGRRWPSLGALILAATIAVASAIVAPHDADRFAAFVPILGCAAAAPALLRGSSQRAACRSTP